MAQRQDGSDQHPDSMLSLASRTLLANLDTFVDFHVEFSSGLFYTGAFEVEEFNAKAIQGCIKQLIQTDGAKWVCSYGWFYYP
jgi:predicted deacylase